jgi:ABC-type branched-subunit amino acid transport system substrate-binding protein
MRLEIILSWTIAVGVMFTGAVPAWSQNAPGITNTEITIGQTMAYSGRASAYATTSRAEAAYFEMIDDEGGVNGRKIHLISVDDGYNPARTVEQVRNLVEQQNVTFLFSTLGTGSNTAIEKYLNDKKIPQLFILTGADRLDSNLQNRSAHLWEIYSFSEAWRQNRGALSERRFWKGWPERS